MKLLLTILLFPFIVNSQSIFAINTTPPISGMPGGGDTTVVCLNPTFSFKSNWLTDNTLGLWATPNYTSTRIAYDATTPTWHGRPSAKVEVRFGDNNDLDPDTHCDNGDCERAEVAEMPGASTHGDGLIHEEDAIGDTVYIAFSFKIPSAWNSHTNQYQVILQEKGPNEFSINPLCAIFINQTTISFGYRSGDITVHTTITGNNIGNINFDGWTDLIIVTHYEKDPTGFFKVYRRDEGATGWQLVFSQFNISTYQYNPAHDAGHPAVSDGAIGYHYWKQGLYRASVNRTDTYNMGPVVRAFTFADVECAAFGTNNGVAN